MYTSLNPLPHKVNFGHAHLWQYCPDYPTPSDTSSVALLNLKPSADRPNNSGQLLHKPRSRVSGTKQGRRPRVRSPPLLTGLRNNNSTIHCVCMYSLRNHLSYRFTYKCNSSLLVIMTVWLANISPPPPPPPPCKSHTQTQKFTAANIRTRAIHIWGLSIL